jgi:hypothetical protein
MNESIERTVVKGPAVMKKLFWLSDVNSEVRGQKPEVWI